MCVDRSMVRRRCHKRQSSTVDHRCVDRCHRHHAVHAHDHDRCSTVFHCSHRQSPFTVSAAAAAVQPRRHAASAQCQCGRPTATTRRRPTVISARRLSRLHQLDARSTAVHLKTPSSRILQPWQSSSVHRTYTATLSTARYYIRRRVEFYTLGWMFTFTV